MAINSARGFPEMYGSIDCMHWKWDKCSIGWEVPTQGIRMGLPWFLRLLHLMICGYDMPSLVSLVL
jgi:hypothetical protein